MQQHLTRAEQANLIAGHAVSYATAYLDGRHTAQQLADNADRLFLDLLVISNPETSAFLVPVQLLAVAMMRTARRKIPDSLDTDALAERWHAVMAALVELVLNESRQLNKDRA
ncbi:hypothetical protein MA20_32065 [Bradyrhizobium japonicum]|uniref:Uncharacterized protein n=1 Tax=Bradyrhizobium japonicum TaxID=375 RepID=A0A0A3XN60_BRAJP|nr:hypothetical protein [Bradyrhizobium japonicum]KGT75825.1 hypothetical protein MA20_32065 [Bradyrhizobium japonicum]